MQHWHENTSQHREVLHGYCDGLCNTLKLAFMVDKPEWQQLFLKEENKRIYPTMLTVSRKSTGIILGLYINVLSFLLKKLQGYAHKHEAFQVFGCLFLLLFMVCIVVYLAERLWFSIYAFHGFEWAQLWVMGLDNNHTNTHKYAQTHTHTDNTQSEVTQVRWEEKKSIPVKRFELIDWENKFATCSYLFISPLEKQSGGYWECWASFPDTDSLTPIVSNEDFQVISWSESGPIRV